MSTAAGWWLKHTGKGQDGCQELLVMQQGIRERTPRCLLPPRKDGDDLIPLSRLKSALLGCDLARSVTWERCIATEPVLCLQPGGRWEGVCRLGGYLGSPRGQAHPSPSLPRPLTTRTGLFSPRHRQTSPPKHVVRSGESLGGGRCQF